MYRLPYCILICGFVCILNITGCRRTASETPEQATPEKQSVAIQQPIINNGEALNDTERLNEIAKKISQAIGEEYTVIFGTPTVNSPLVMVDYSLFESLSDAGVAVLVTDSILQKSERQEDTSLPPQKRLRMDTEIGNYVALAGYEPDGFKDCLEQTNRVSFETEGSNMPSMQSRICAFLEGYQKGQLGKQTEQSTVK